MKFRNKFINGILLAGLLFFLFGCDKNEAVFGYAKGIGIQYADKDGSISYFDKNDYYSQIKNIKRRRFSKDMPNGDLVIYE
jgi:hypothetical protein